MKKIRKEKKPHTYARPPFWKLVYVMLWLRERIRTDDETQRKLALYIYVCNIDRARARGTDPDEHRRPTDVTLFRPLLLHVPHCNRSA